MTKNRGLFSLQVSRAERDRPLDLVRFPFLPGPTVEQHLELLTQLANPVSGSTMTSLNNTGMFGHVFAYPATLPAASQIIDNNIGMNVMVGFTTRACEQGTTLWRSTDVTAINRDGSGITGVQTTRGEVSTRVVVNAAGAWASEVAALAAVNLPVEPMRRMLIPTEPFDEVSHEVPMVIDMTNGFHFRPESLGFLLAWNDPEETTGFNTKFDPTFIEKVLTLAADRIPCFENLAVNPKRAWAGLYEMSPDHHAIIGQVEELLGFFCANGFSGHGVMHSPATGRMVADLILHGKTDIVDNVELLSPARFAKGEMLHETAVL